MENCWMSHQRILMPHEYWSVSPYSWCILLSKIVESDRTRKQYKNVLYPNMTSTEIEKLLNEPQRAVLAPHEYWFVPPAVDIGPVSYTDRRGTCHYSLPCWHNSCTNRRDHRGSSPQLTTPPCRPRTDPTQNTVDLVVWSKICQGVAHHRWYETENWQQGGTTAAEKGPLHVRVYRGSLRLRQYGFGNLSWPIPEDTGPYYFLSVQIRGRHQLRHGWYLAVLDHHNKRSEEENRHLFDIWNENTQHVDREKIQWENASGLQRFISQGLMHAS